MNVLLVDGVHVKPSKMASATVGSVTGRVTLKRKERSLDLNVSQVTSVNLKRVFNVSPLDVWLSDDIDDQVFIPELDGSFQGLPQFHTFIVEGTNDFDNQTLALSSCTPRRPVPVPTFRSVLASASKKVPIFRVKVVRAHMTWDGKSKPSFATTQQIYVEVQESTANATYILGEVKERWGPSYVLVGLVLEDTPSTQGLLSVRRNKYPLLS